MASRSAVPSKLATSPAQRSSIATTKREEGGEAVAGSTGGAAGAPLVYDGGAGTTGLPGAQIDGMGAGVGGAGGGAEACGV